MNDIPKVILVKKLPEELSDNDINDMLKYFGAISVSIMSPNGRMKGCAFAEFKTSEEAEIAMRKLHQAVLFKSRMVAVFSDKAFLPVDQESCMQKPEPSQIIAQDCQKCVQSKQPDPSLHYLYPPPNSHILNNISHALVSVPQFYIQVLHLMNKMNLPPPFIQSNQKSLFESAPIPPPSMVSTSESELETEEEDEGPPSDTLVKEIMEEKRATTQAFIDRKRKREVSGGATNVTKKLATSTIQSSEVYISAESCGQDVVTMKSDDKPEDNIPLAPSTSTHSKPQEPNHPPCPPPPPPPPFPPPDPMISPFPPPDHVAAEKDALPKQPKPAPSPQSFDVVMEDSVPENTREKDFEAYRKTIRRKQKNESELSTLTVFKKYSSGEVSNKLYIKNLNHKLIKESELSQIFKPYYEFYKVDASISFEIKLMVKGQMKGQAFVTLPSNEAAQVALEDTHGYCIHDKPMSVMFARSKS